MCSLCSGDVLGWEEEGRESRATQSLRRMIQEASLCAQANLVSVAGEGYVRPVTLDNYQY